LTEPSRPIPFPDAETAPYWTAAHEHRLTLPQCQDCRHIAFPPKPRCPKCHSPQMVWVPLTGRGTLHSYTVMHDTFVRGLEPPFVIGDVELEDQAGLCIVANLVECAPAGVHIGMPLEVTYEDVTEDITLPQFRPAGKTP